MKKHHEYISLGIANLLFFLISVLVFTKLELIYNSLWLSVSFFLTTIAMMILVISSAGLFYFESYKVNELNKFYKVLFKFFSILIYYSIFCYIGDTNNFLSIFYPVLQAIISFIFFIFLIFIVCLVEICINKFLIFETLKFPKHIL